MNSFRFFHRHSEEFGNWDFKIEVHSGGKWLDGQELEEAFCGGPQTFVGKRLHDAVGLLMLSGLDEEQLPKLLSRKQVHTRHPLPLEGMRALGWDTIPYPVKFGRVKDPAKLLREAYERGIGVDVSNVISSQHTCDTRGLALKGLVDWTVRLNLRTFLYVDKSTWGWLKGNGLFSLLEYLDSSCNGSPLAKVVTAPFNKKADDLMVYWADNAKQPQLTRDELDEYDMTFDWLLHGAERGEPRIHKFCRVDHNHIRIPSFDSTITVPERF